MPKQMNLTNYHSHCSFCDGKAPVEDFVKSAIAAGFTSYGVSSHAPLPFETRWTLPKEKVTDYLREISRLKEKYAGIIDLYSGMEIDYLNVQQGPAISYFQNLPLDYRIGSVHLIYTDGGEIIDTDTNPENFRELLEQYFHGDLRRMVERYLDVSMQMAEAGGFDFIGHADKISYNASVCDPEILEKDWFQKHLYDYFAFIAEKDIMLEINTKAFLTKGCFFPQQRHFRFLKQLKIPVIVNSDAHRPELINAGRMEALQALKEAGFQTVMEMKRGKWVAEMIGC